MIQKSPSSAAVVFLPCPQTLRVYTLRVSRASLTSLSVYFPPPVLVGTSLSVYFPPPVLVGTSLSVYFPPPVLVGQGGKNVQEEEEGTAASECTSEQKRKKEEHVPFRF